MTVRQETLYPDSETVRLTFDSAEPVDLSLRVRYPAWATEGLRVSINGRRHPVDAKPGSFV